MDISRPPSRAKSEGQLSRGVSAPTRHWSAGACVVHFVERRIFSSIARPSDLRRRLSLVFCFGLCSGVLNSASVRFCGPGALPASGGGPVEAPDGRFPVGTDGVGPVPGRWAGGCITGEVFCNQNLGSPPSLPQEHSAAVAIFSCLGAAILVKAGAGE